MILVWVKFPYFLGNKSKSLNSSKDNLLFLFTSSAFIIKFKSSALICLLNTILNNFFFNISKLITSSFSIFDISNNILGVIVEFSYNILFANLFSQ